MTLDTRFNPMRKLPREAQNHFLVDDKYRLVYCHVPKVASTSWIRVFLVLSGVFNHTYDADQAFVNRGAMQHLRLLSTYDGRDVQAILNNYTKFLFVRNPYSRLLSAYRNKLESRSRHTGRPPWRSWIDLIKRQNQNKSTTGVNGHTETSDLSFAEFVRFVSNPKTKTSNKHWSPLVNRCHPCHINYTFVGKIESLETDVEYMFQLTKIDKLVKFPDAEGSSPTNSTELMTSYYVNVTLNDMALLYRKFKWDFELFGYNNSLQKEKR